MKIGDDVRVGDLWHSDATGVTCLIIELLGSRDGVEIAVCLDVSDLELFDYGMSRKHSSYYLVSRLDT